MMEYTFLSDEKVKMHLSVDEASETVKVKLEPKADTLWSGKIRTRPTLDYNNIYQMQYYLKVPDCLEMQSNILDQSRIHPRYAKYLNHQYKLFHKQLFHQDASSENVQLSYANGLSFIGNAILQFVASLVVFHESAEDMTNGMMEREVNKLMSTGYFAFLCKRFGWNSMLAYNSKNLSIECKKGKKVYSDVLKGWLGALYASNSTEHLPEILEVAKKILYTDSSITFKSSVQPKYNENSLILGACIGFTLGTFTMALISCVWIYYMPL